MSNFIEKPRSKTYKEWWNSNIETVNGYREVNNIQQTNGMYVREFYENIKDTIKRAGFEIDNEKQLKSEIATLIYNLSEDTI